MRRWNQWNVIPGPSELCGSCSTGREALVLRFYLDLPEAEIARLLGCRPGTVKSRISRALKQLREWVDVD